MEITFELIISASFGFLFGCLLTLIIMLIIMDLQDKKAARKREERHMIISAIGKLCASVDNSYAAYRMGSMNFESLRDIIRNKIGEIHSELTSNIDDLDPYYIKNIERFIEDQKSFLLSREERRPDQTGQPGLRNRSRGDYLFTDENARHRSTPATAPQPAPTPTSKEVPYPPETDTAVSLTSLMRADTPQEPTTNTAPPQPPVQTEETGTFTSEAMAAFESGATTRLTAEELNKLKETPSTQVTPTFDQTATQQFKVDPQMFPTIDDKHEKAMREDKTVYDVPAFRPPEEEAASAKGKPVFDSPVDVEATQEFNVEDLLEKTKRKQSKKDRSDEESSLITGDDVMDQMDSLFGFEES